MTKTKGAKLVQELIEKYGDFVVVKLYDYYATCILTDNRFSTKKEDVIVREVHMSEIPVINSWSDYKNFEAMAQGRRPIEYHGVIVKESQEKYNSKEQEDARKKHRQEFRNLISHMMGAYPVREWESMIDMSTKLDVMSQTDTKTFGMAMDNHKRR